MTDPGAWWPLGTVVAMASRARRRCWFGPALVAAVLVPTLLAPAPVGARETPAAPAPTAEGSCTGSCWQPDALVRRWRETTYVGEDVYNWDSLGQTRVALVPPNGRARFGVRIENDGEVADDLAVKGIPDTPRFLIRYFVGTTDVSPAVRAGTFRFTAVPPGAGRLLRVEVTSRPGTPEGAKVAVTVAVRSADHVAFRDRVKAVVYRSRGVETPIEGRSYTTAAAAQRWARANGASPRFVQNARLYWELAPSRGIRPEVAYAQSAKETAYGNFGGVLTPAWRNSCGLKTTAGGGNDDPNAHQRFPNWRVGVIACIDHLALYAGAPTYPRANTPDPRHFTSVYAVAPTVERLGGRWAPDRDYGRDIVRSYLTPLLGY